MDLTPFAPVKFTGNFRENASEWLEKFELYCDATDIQSHKIYQVFPLFLEKYAFTWYRGLESEIKQNKGELFKKFYGNMERRTETDKNSSADSQIVDNSQVNQSRTSLTT